MKQNEKKADPGCQQDRAQQQCHLTEVVPLAPCLSGQAGRAHAHEAKGPVQDAEQIGTNGDGAKILRAFQVAEHGRIHQSQERDGEVGEHQWPGQGPETSVGCRQVKRHMRFNS